MVNKTKQIHRLSDTYKIITGSSVRAVLAAHSANGGSGIAHLSRTDKLAEASRRICEAPTTDTDVPAIDGIYIST